MASINTQQRNNQQSPIQELERAIQTCFLWENSFYENGNQTAKRISELIPNILKSEDLHNLIRRSRCDMHIRHAPLFCMAEMMKYPRHKEGVIDLINDVIHRPDDATELIALYWRNGKLPLPNQFKKGLAHAVTKFSEYQLSKYQNKGAIKLIDVFNLVHPKPCNKEQEKIWKKFVKNDLEPADTWEVRISASGNKPEIWQELMLDKKLGGLALLRNLRNMIQCGVDLDIIKAYIEESRFDKVLPFRFIAAARHAPDLESILEKKMLEALKDHPKLEGKTILLVDVSGSMDSTISAKSDMTRMDAACALAMMIREICTNVEIATFSNHIVKIPPRQGFYLRDTILKSQIHGGTYLGAAMDLVNQIKDVHRIIVFTDEQSSDQVPDPSAAKAYMINVASYEKTVTTSKWVGISGFSEQVVNYIQMIENI